MPKFRSHACYVHDFRTYGMERLANTDRESAFALLVRAYEDGLVAHTDVQIGPDLLLNKGFAVVRRIGDKALVLHVHDGEHRLALMDWVGITRKLYEGGYEIPATFRAIIAEELRT